MISLGLYQRVPRGTGLIQALDGVALGWKRTTRAIGGYWTATFTVRPDVLGWVGLAEAFDSWLGCRVVESTAGMTTWEGLVYELRLLSGGREYLRTLAPEWWHNRVQVVYREVGGGQATIAWSENADSSDEYGEMNYLLSLPETTSNAATAARDRHLKEFAWPRTRLVGGLAWGAGSSQAGADALAVTVAGYWATLNWRYTAASSSDTASALVTTLVGTSELVTAGRIETNSLAARTDCGNPQRTGDLIEDLARQGDASGNVWRCGVYGGRKVDYDQAPTAVSHYLSAGRLVEISGAEVLSSTLRPGFLLRDLDAPLRLTRAGTASAWDDPAVAYVDEVEYTYPDGLRLKVYDQEESLAVLEAQSRAPQGEPSVSLVLPGEHPIAGW